MHKTGEHTKLETLNQKLAPLTLILLILQQKIGPETEPMI